MQNAPCVGALIIDTLLGSLGRNAAHRNCSLIQKCLTVKRRMQPFGCTVLVWEPSGSLHALVPACVTIDAGLLGCCLNTACARTGGAVPDGSSGRWFRLNVYFLNYLRALGPSRLPGRGHCGVTTPSVVGVSRLHRAPQITAPTALHLFYNGTRQLSRSLRFTHKHHNGCQGAHSPREKTIRTPALVWHSQALIKAHCCLQPA
jgi:hypothetical protein